jgi:hypothetical protein
MNRRILKALRWIVPPALLVCAVTVPGSAQAGAGFADVRRATTPFHDIQAANDAGYGDNALPCFQNEAGGMGEHLINPDLLLDGGALDPLRPEALVYEVRADTWKFVGVEYVVLFSDVPRDAEDPPELFGQEFSPNDSLGLWALHAWIWRGNPAGILSTWNPAVKNCPSD